MKRYADPHLLCIKQVAEILAVDPVDVEKVIRRGQFPAPVRIGSLERWLHEDVVEYVNVLSRERWWYSKPYAGKSICTPFTGPVPSLLDPFKSELVRDYQLPAVYFLLNGGIVVYVGSSIDPRKRIPSHANGGRNTPPKVFEDAAVLPVPLEEMLERERYFIALFNPPLNIALKRPDLARNAEVTEEYTEPE